MNTLIMYLDELADRCHITSKAHGFWDAADDLSLPSLELAVQAQFISALGQTVEKIRQGERPDKLAWFPHDYPPLSNSQITILAKLVLVVSEVAEAIDAVVTKADGLDKELADIIIRVADLARWIPVEFGKAIVTKMVINESRPYRHNKLA